MTATPARILVVEDSHTGQASLACALEEHGYMIALAENGRQAWAMLQEQAFDLVLLDILMPQVNGYQALESMKSDSTLRNIPTIVVSAAEDMDSIVHCIGMGAEDYLTRPFDSVLLSARIGACLEKKRLRDAERAYLEQLEQRNYALFQLSRFGQQLAALLDMQQITEQLPRAIAEIVGAEGASLWLWDTEHEGKLICRAMFHPGLSQPLLLNRALQPGQGIAGWVSQHDKSIMIPHAPSDPRFFPGIDEQTGFKTVSVLAAPLRAHFAVIGVMEVVNKVEGVFDSDDMALVETLAVSAATAIDNAVLFDARRELADELKARNEELDAFAHTVAHDLKGALTNIIGFASVVRDSHDKMSDEQVHKCLQMIVQSGQKMASVVDELMLLASVGRANAMGMAPLDMAELVGQVRDRLLFMIEEYQAEIVLPSSWPVALGYGPWVEEVWANYLSNAIKYGGQPPRIELGATPQADGMIHFWARDNGQGIGSEGQLQLFMPFERLHRAGSGGHGLGLSIARRIVERLGGRVDVASQVGQGSTFGFTLPSQELSRSVTITQSDWLGS